MRYVFSTTPKTYHRLRVSTDPSTGVSATKYRKCWASADARRRIRWRRQRGISTESLSLFLLLLPQYFDSLLDAVEDETAHVAMVSWPLLVLCVTATRSRRRMEVISRVVRVWMPIPSALPRTNLAFLLIVEIKIVVSVPADLEASGHFVRVVLVGQIDTKV